VRSLLLAALFAVASAAQAQDYPAHPVRLIVSNAAGSSVDIAARLIGQKLGEGWGQQVVVDNRPGANGIIGMDAAAKAKPDGYTLATAVPSAMAINQFIYKKLPYQPLRDFAPVTQTTRIDFVLVVNPALKAESVAELVALARARPGELNFSSSGVGNLNHLAGELFAMRTGAQLTHVPNKGDTPAMLDVMAGETQLMFATLPGALPHIRSGKLRALAICGEARAADFPDLPTLAEAGVAGVTVTGWTAVVAPAGTPAPIVRKIQADIARALETPELKETLAKQGAAPVGSPPDAFAAFLVAEAAKWSKVIAEAGLALTVE
jgi:tripartite-type tricarboxylate transporter receptor subunit TctC